MDEYCLDHSAHVRALAQHDKRLDGHSVQLDKLNEAIATLREIERQNQERLDGQDKRIDALEAKPAARWETATGCVLTAVIGIVLGMAAGQIGL